MTGLIRRYTFLVALAVVIGGTPTVSSADNRVNTGYFGDVAIEGYDTVAYFTEGRAVKGSPEFEKEFLGEKWHFASRTNLERFSADPVAFAPQYGGYCAGEVPYAHVSTGVTSNIDPTAWRIIDGKLYLFFSEAVAAEFEEAGPEAIDAANQQWPTVAERLENQ